MRLLPIYLLFTLSFTFPVTAQEITEYKKNAISVDLLQTAVNEINFNYERYFTPRRSVELSAGLIYVNEILEDFSKEWTNSHYFSEHGFAARIAYKLYKKPLEEKSRWKDYIAPVIVYKYMYFNNQWFENELDAKYSECLFQRRFRHKLGLEFLWGKIYELNNTFSLEFYYGVGLRGTQSIRTDILKQDTCNVSPIREINFEDKSFYIRPTLRGGAKIRLSF